jgi:hypothetical protein
MRLATLFFLVVVGASAFQTMPTMGGVGRQVRNLSWATLTSGQWTSLTSGQWASMGS